MASKERERQTSTKIGKQTKNRKIYKYMITDERLTHRKIERKFAILHTERIYIIYIYVTYILSDYTTSKLKYKETLFKVKTVQVKYVPKINRDDFFLF